MVSEDEVYQRMSAELDDVRGSEGFKGANVESRLEERHNKKTIL